MMTDLKISKTLSLPDDYVTKTLAILAKRRVGKTYTASVLAEEMVAAKIPWVALDPTGAWWGLRSSADGKKPGLPVVIIGGGHGDLPLERGAGKFIADLVVDHPGWYVIDLSLFESLAAERQFVTDFADRIYRRKFEKGMDFPLHLFVDEADKYIPQRPQPGDQKMLGAFEAIVRRGGIRGFGTTLISQRSAVVNKNVLEQIDTLIVLQMMGTNDRKAVDDILKSEGNEVERKTLMGTLPGLGVGEAWIYEPGGDPPLFDRVQIRERRTFNSSATPKPGQKRVEPSKFAAVDLSAVKDQMAEAIERAEANDPRTLHKRVAELEKLLATARKNTVAEPVVRYVEKIVEVEVAVPFIPRDLATLLRDELSTDFAKNLNNSIEVVVAKIQERTGNDVAPKSPTPVKRVTIGRPAPQPSVTEAAQDAESKARHANSQPARTENSDGDSASSLSKAERAILSVLAQFPDGRTRPQLAMLTGYSAKSGNFANALGKLRTQEFIDRGTPIRITDGGFDAMAGAYDPLPQGRALLAHWQSKLSKAAREILELAIDAWPASLTRDEVAERTGYAPTSGNFANALGKLRTLELISGRGEIMADETLAREVKEQ